MNFNFIRANLFLHHKEPSLATDGKLVSRNSGSCRRQTAENHALASVATPAIDGSLLNTKWTTLKDFNQAIYLLYLN